MKQLLSLACIILYMQSIAQAPLDARTTSLKPVGKKDLVKALLAIVNRENQKKMPVKRTATLPPKTILLD